ncbi:MAG TPA: metal-sulfur cluster assembly factor [Bdellovibrionota bacterium]|jgi:metal-sulfur cluster biosynthetic enzyme
MSEENKPADAAALPPPAPDGLLEWLRPVQDPELFMGLVDLGLIYGIDFKDGKADVRMTLTSPGCPAADHLVSEVKKRLLEYPGVTAADVMVVFEPKWDPRTMASDEVKDRLGIW